MKFEPMKPAPPVTNSRTWSTVLPGPKWRTCPLGPSARPACYNDRMPVDLTVYLDHRPGQVSAVGRCLGDAGVNLLGGFALVVGGQGIMHVLVEDDDATTAYQALEAQGFQTTEEEEVVVVDIEDRPGALG